MELLNWRVKQLEVAQASQQGELLSLSGKVQNINSEIVKELNEIRESLAWIKGRFALVEGKRDDS